MKLETQDSEVENTSPLKIGRNPKERLVVFQSPHFPGTEQAVKLQDNFRGVPGKQIALN